MKDNETPIAWLSNGGALMLDRHISGLTQDLLQTTDESPEDLTRTYQGRYLLCESVDEEAAKRIARAFGFEWSEEPIKLDEPELAVFKIYGREGSGSNLLARKLMREAERRDRRVLIVEDTNDVSTCIRTAKNQGFHLLILTFNLPYWEHPQYYVKIETDSDYFTKLLAL